MGFFEIRVGEIAFFVFLSCHLMIVRANIKRIGRLRPYTRVQRDFRMKMYFEEYSKIEQKKLANDKSKNKLI